MTESMNEKVARALVPYAFKDQPGHNEGECDVCDGNRRDARDQARRAIEAMRSPSQEIIDILEGPPRFDGGDAWSALIDAALNNPS